MKVIIAGSRKITDYQIVSYAIYHCEFSREITRVVCGMAKGVDLLGKHWADIKGIPVSAFRPDYETYGSKVAPIMRNEAMAEYADALILVWNGDPKTGSGDMLKRAQRHGLKISQFIVDLVTKKVTKI